MIWSAALEDTWIGIGRTHAHEVPYAVPYSCQLLETGLNTTAENAPRRYVTQQKQPAAERGDDAGDDDGPDHDHVRLPSPVPRPAPVGLPNGLARIKGGDGNGRAEEEGRHEQTLGRGLGLVVPRRDERSRSLFRVHSNG